MEAEHAMIYLANENVILQLAEEENVLALLAVTFGCFVAVVGIVSCTVGGVMKARAKEASRRELAAYVAEGTIDPDKAVAMLNAGMPKYELPDIEKLMGKKA